MNNKDFEELGFSNIAGWSAPGMQTINEYKKDNFKLTHSMPDDCVLISVDERTHHIGVFKSKISLETKLSDMQYLVRPSNQLHVAIELKPDQRFLAGDLWRYKFTHHGKLKLVSNINVEYYCDTLEEAQKSYDPLEIVSVQIKKI